MSRRKPSDFRVSFYPFACANDGSAKLIPELVEHLLRPVDITPYFHRVLKENAATAAAAASPTSTLDLE